jgi:hypothetical protein
MHVVIGGKRHTAARKWSCLRATNRGRPPGGAGCPRPAGGRRPRGRVPKGLGQAGCAAPWAEEPGRSAWRGQGPCSKERKERRERPAPGLDATAAHPPPPASLGDRARDRALSLSAANKLYAQLATFSRSESPLGKSTPVTVERCDGAKPRHCIPGVHAGRALGDAGSIEACPPGVSGSAPDRVRVRSCPEVARVASRGTQAPRRVRPRPGIEVARLGACCLNAHAALWTSVLQCRGRPCSHVGSRPRSVTKPDMRVRLRCPLVCFVRAFDACR